MDSLSSAYISVVIPTRNRAQLLARTLQAIKAQSFQRFEVIVVDDASDEYTRSQYREVWTALDSRFILHSLGQNGNRGLGPSITRNIGLSIAHGEVIAFCDDDDFWTASDHLESMASIFLARPEIDMYIANQTGVSSHGIEIEDWFPKLTAALASRAVSSEPGNIVSIQELCEAGGFAHLNILSLRKRPINQFGGFWERVTYEEDRDFFWRMLDSCNKVFYNPKIVAQHNIPDPKKTDNQSTQHPLVERWLLAILVCQHIATSAKHPSISGLARRYEGDLLRRLATHFASAGQHALGFAFARQALGARFSFKWSGYLTLLAFKALLINEVR
ncbi:Glycosyl transferase family 2 [Noviherbaspirillum suwonense]|uniref:Glycosyl transferase family 2 n=2 Tax=Noviherbaspirillum suwonense TaxID=1224511 RepID=A0ABY1QW15_9BURK|nr:Glycosyl transferase family 2 [Noviherbaspirillum suwonense]